MYRGVNSHTLNIKHVNRLPFKPTAFILSYILLFGCNYLDKVVVEPGVSKSLAVSRKANLTDLEYNLEFTMLAEKDSAIFGHERISFKIKDTGKPLILDFNVANQQAVISLKVNNEPASYSFRDEHIIIDHRQLQAGYNSIEIDFIAGDQSLNRNEDYLYTLFVPDRASTAFPCFDQPDLKAVFDLTLNIPEHWNAMSNGPIDSSLPNNEKLGDPIKTIKFKTSDLISTYLFSFVAGEFETIASPKGTIAMTMFHREIDTALVQRNSREIFDLHARSLAWLEEYTGIDYPFQKFDFALIPEFQYGGMEHVGAILYRASALLLDESATLDDRLRRASLIAHETAHMWFGNYVTMEWFDDVWTKEVFANFMADKITQPMFPDVNHNLKFLFSHYPPAYEIDRTEGANAIRQNLDNLKNAGTLYGNIIYHKAPIVMRQLEEIVGGHVFQSAIRNYLSDHAFANATWPDLISEIDFRTETNIKKWSDVWIDSPGYPLVDLEMISTPDISEYDVIQYDLTGEGKIWPQRFIITLTYANGEIDFPILMNHRHYIMPKSKTNPDPKFIQLNTLGSGYGVFNYGMDYEKEDFLFNKAKVDISSESDENRRGATYLNLHEFLLLEGFNPQLYFSFLKIYFESEQNELIIKYLLDNISLVFWKFMTPEMREKNGWALEIVLMRKLNAVSSLPLKSLIFKHYINLATTPTGVKTLENFWYGRELPTGIVLTEKLKIKLAEQLALKNAQEGMAIFERQIDSVKNLDKKRRMQFIQPAFSSDIKVRDQFFAMLKNSENRAHEPWVLDGLSYLHHPLRNEASVHYLKASLDLLEELQTTGDIFFPKRWLDRIFWGYHSRGSVNIINQFLIENPDLSPNLRMKILQSADMVFRAERELNR